MQWVLVLLVLLSTLTLGGCEIAGDIFKAGFWVGIVAVVLVVAGIGFVFAKMRG
jgi:hypothetical protein